MKFSRKEIWLHNSFLGRAAMAEKGMIDIITSQTATPKAKRFALRVQKEARNLAAALKKRVDQ